MRRPAAGGERRKHQGGGRPEGAQYGPAAACPSLCCAARAARAPAPWLGVHFRRVARCVLAGWARQTAGRALARRGTTLRPDSPFTPRLCLARLCARRLLLPAAWADRRREGWRQRWQPPCWRWALPQGGPPRVVPLRRRRQPARSRWRALRRRWLRRAAWGLWSPPWSHSLLLQPPRRPARRLALRPAARVTAVRSSAGRSVATRWRLPGRR